MITEQNPTIAQATAFIIAEIRQDIADGLYEDAPQLDSFTVLHDYCDANDYIIAAAEKFCLFSNDSDDEETHLLWQDWADEVCDAVDTLLNEQPIEL
jgi:hypothetical protein